MSPRVIWHDQIGGYWGVRLRILFETHVRPFIEFPYRLDLRLLAIAKQQLVINVAFHATIFRLHCDSQPNFAMQPTVAQREVDFTGLLWQ